MSNNRVLSFKISLKLHSCSVINIEADILSTLNNCDAFAEENIHIFENNEFVNNLIYNIIIVEYSLIFHSYLFF